MLKPVLFMFIIQINNIILRSHLILFIYVDQIWFACKVITTEFEIPTVGHLRAYQSFASNQSIIKNKQNHNGMVWHKPKNKKIKIKFILR